MVKAIVYTSGAGHTKQYAEILGAKENLPVYDLKSAKGALPKGSEIVYLGWLMAGTVKGFRKANRRYAVKAVCGVGMANGDSQFTDMKKNNPISDEMSLFYLQGGFELEKLRGVYHLMMKTMKATVGKALADKADRTPEDDAMLEMLQDGKNAVSEENLESLCRFIEEQKA